MTVTCSASVSQCGSGLAHSSCRLQTVTAGVYAVLWSARHLETEQTLPRAAQPSFWSCVVVVCLIAQGCV